MKKSLKLIAFGLLISSICIGCTKPRINTSKPHHGKIQQSFTELAKTKLKNIYDINMPFSGELARITLSPGDEVKKGQVIARLIQLPWAEYANRAQARLK